MKNLSSSWISRLYVWLVTDAGARIIYLSEYRHVYIHLHTHIHICIYVYIYIYMHTHIFTYIQNYAYICIYIYAHTHIFTYIQNYAYICIYIYAHTHIFTYIQNHGEDYQLHVGQMIGAGAAAEMLGTTALLPFEYTRYLWFLNESIIRICVEWQALEHRGNTENGFVDTVWIYGACVCVYMCLCRICVRVEQLCYYRLNRWGMLGFCRVHIYTHQDSDTHT